MKKSAKIVIALQVISTITGIVQLLCIILRGWFIYHPLRYGNYYALFSLINLFHIKLIIIFCVRR